MKKEYLILAAIIVVLGAYLYFQDANRSEYELPAISSVAAKEVTQLTLEKSGHQILLKRDGDDWTLGEEKFLADSNKVKQMLAIIENFRLTALVSASKAYSRYDLDEDKRIAVKAYIGDRVVREFDVGKEADTYQHTFVKLPKDPNIYHAQKDFKRTFDVTIDDLRDKKVLSLSPSTITEFSVVSLDKSVTLAQKEVPAEEEAGVEEKKTDKTPSAEEDKAESKHIWQDAAGNTVKEETVTGFLSKFSHMTCNGYIKDKTKKDYKDPILTVTLKGAQTDTLSIFEKKEDDIVYPAVSSQNGYPFTLSKSLMDQIQNGMDALMPTEKES